MLVNESKFFKSGSNARLRICLWNEIDVLIDCSLDVTVDKLKAEILLQHFTEVAQPQDRPSSRDVASYAPLLSSLSLDANPQLDETIAKETIYHKIIHVRNGTQLREEDSLKNQGVKDNGENQNEN